MAYSDLREFIRALERNNELKRIKLPVSSDQEITEITDRVSKSKESNKALLFENVDGGKIPVTVVHPNTVRYRLRREGRQRVWNSNSRSDGRRIRWAGSCGLSCNRCRA